MKSMEELLGDGFFRCHRGYLVNLAYVAEYGTGAVRLKNGENVYLAREKYSEFAKTYTKYLKPCNSPGPRPDIRESLPSDRHPRFGGPG